MKKVIIPLVVGATIVSIIFAGCRPAPAPAAPREIPKELLTSQRDIMYEETCLKTGLVRSDLTLNPFGENFAVKPDGTPYLFARSYHHSRCEWMYSSEFIMKSLIERAGGQYVSHCCELDAEKQLAFIDNVITVIKPDCLNVQAADEVMCAPGVEKAMAAGIPTFIYDLGIGTENYVCYVQHDFDAPEIGSCVVGEYFNRIQQETGKPIKVFEVWANRGEESTWDRMAGFELGWEGNPMISKVESVDTLWAFDANAAAVMDAFTADPTLNAIFYPDGGAEGCVEGLRSIGRLLPIGDPGHVLGGSNTPSSAMIEFMRDRVWDCTATHQSWDLADVLVKEMFWYVVCGQQVPHVVTIPMYLMTADNLDTERAFGVPLAYGLMPMGQWDIFPVMDTREIGVNTPTLADRLKLKGY